MCPSSNRDRRHRTASRFDPFDRRSRVRPWIFDRGWDWRCIFLWDCTRLRGRRCRMVESIRMIGGGELLLCCCLLGWW